MAKHCRNGSSVEKPLESYSWFARQLAFHWTVRLLNNGSPSHIMCFQSSPWMCCRWRMCQGQCMSPGKLQSRALLASNNGLPRGGNFHFHWMKGTYHANSPVFPGKTMENPWFPTVPYGSRWFPTANPWLRVAAPWGMLQRSWWWRWDHRLYSHFDLAVRNAILAERYTKKPWRCGCTDTQTHTHRAIHIYWHSFTYTQYTCDVCVYTYIHTHIYIIYIILYNMYYIYILFEILRKSPSVSWVPTRHDNIVQMIILCTFAGLLQHFGVDMYRWLNHTKPIVPNP